VTNAIHRTERKARGARACPITMYGTKTIEEVTEKLIDYRGRTPKKTESGVKLITAKVIKGGFIVDGDHEFIAPSDYDLWMRRGMPRQWDILITTEAPLGELAQLRSPEKIALAQRVILLRGKPSVIHQSYFFHALKSPIVQAQLRARSSGTTVLGIKQSELLQVKIPCPPLPIQNRIAALLSPYDTLIENNTHRIKILEDMAQMIYRQWFVDFRFPGHEKVRFTKDGSVSIPEGWESKHLGDLTEVITKGTTPTTLGKDFQPSGINFVKVESISESGVVSLEKLAKIDEETHELLKRSQLREKDILFSIAGAIGRTALVTERFLPANTNQALAIIRCADPLLVPYVYLTVRFPKFQHFSLGRVVQTAQANVSLSILRSAPIIVPSADILSRFNNSVVTMLNLVDLLTRKIDILRTTRELLLPKLISGEVSLDHLQPETASQIS